jgi:hypothetical protein
VTYDRLEFCVDGPDTGNFVGRAVWTSCNDAEGTARSKARGFAEGFARNGCSGGLTVVQGTKVCGARGGILIRTTPYLSNTDNYAITISASQGFCSRIQGGLMQPPTYSSAKKCGAQPPSWWQSSWFGNWEETTATTTDKATCGLRMLEVASDRIVDQGVNS